MCSEHFLNVCYLNFVDVDFSRETWLASRGYSGNDTLPSYIISELLHDLDIIQYIGESSCNRKSIPFYPNRNGWNTGNVVQ